jgi:hypothetical protein
LTSRRAYVTVFQKVANGRLARLDRVGIAGRAAGRSEKAVKSLKTNTSTKCLDFAPNDLNDLRPALRNRSFRSAKDSLRFPGFSASSGPKRVSREIVGGFRRTLSHFGGLGAAGLTGATRTPG